MEEELAAEVEAMCVHVCAGARGVPLPELHLEPARLSHAHSSKLRFYDNRNRRNQTHPTDKIAANVLAAAAAIRLRITLAITPPPPYTHLDHRRRPLCLSMLLSSPPFAF